MFPSKEIAIKELEKAEKNIDGFDCIRKASMAS